MSFFKLGKEIIREIWIIVHIEWLDSKNTFSLGERSGIVLIIWMIVFIQCNFSKFSCWISRGQYLFVSEQYHSLFFKHPKNPLLSFRKAHCGRKKKRGWMLVFYGAGRNPAIPASSESFSNRLVISLTSWASVIGIVEFSLNVFCMTILRCIISNFNCYSIGSFSINQHIWL